MPQSQGVANDQAYEKQQLTPADGKKKQEEVLDASLSLQRTRILKRAENANIAREQSHHYFDDMTYLQDYRANEDACNTYLRPKKNKADVRVNTATSEKKVDALLNELLAMNIQPEVRAHDMYDNEIKYLGKDIEGAVVRTNQIEREDDMLEDTFRELIGQRAIFVKEVAVKRYIKNKNYPGGGYYITRLEKRLVSGKKIYLGNITIPAYRFNDQPYYVEYDRVDWDLAQSMYKDNPNLHLAQKGGKMNTSLEFTSLGHAEWRMNNLNDEQAEIIRYKSFVDGEYQEYLNGVPMQPVDAPLPWDWEGYDITMVVVKPISPEFAYGKPPIASAKSLQSLENETIRNLIFKMRQGIQPPVGVLGKKVYSKDIWNAAAVTQGVSANTFSKLIDHDGVTQSEMAMFTQINQITEEFIGVSRATQGLEGRKEKTATETLEQLRQSIKMMGLVIVAAMRLRTNVTYLRIYSILSEYSKPVGKRLDSKTNEIRDKYMNFTLANTDLGEGRRGTKKILFSDRMLTPEERTETYEQEERLAKQGRPTRYRVINVKALCQLPIIWYAVAVQKEKPGSVVDRLMINEKLNQTAGVEKLSMGQVKGNWPALADSISVSWGDRDMFQTAPPPMMGLPGSMPVDPKMAEDMQGVGQSLDELESISQSGIGAQLTEADQQQVRQPEVVPTT